MMQLQCTQSLSLLCCFHSKDFVIMQCTACYVKLFIILSRISVSDIEFKYFLPNSGSGVLVFRTGQVGVWWPSRESGWKQTEIMLLCIISIWFTWLCLMSLAIKRKLAVLCATAGGGIWWRHLKSLMKISSDELMSLSEVSNFVTSGYETQCFLQKRVCWNVKKLWIWQM